MIDFFHQLETYLTSHGCKVPQHHVSAMMYRKKRLGCYEAGLVIWFQQH